MVPPDDSAPTRVERPSGPSRPDREDPAPEPARTPAGGPRYETGAEIARGGMGRVVEATDHRLGRVVAVKEALTDDPDTLRRFSRETRITARLEHPSIVPLYDAGGGEDGAAPYYVMRRVSGKPLEQLVNAAESLDQRLALLPHMIACAQAIAHAHQRGVIHRDLKPTNILVGELGETIVIDWGLAKVVGETDDDLAGGAAALAGDSLRTRIGTVAGTPGFMAPEQARGDVHGMRADVWALGACLYYVLARRPPHATEQTSGDDLVALTAARPVAPVATFARGVPAELAAIVDTALAFREEDRYPDAATLADELQRFAAGQLVASHDYTLAERVVRWAKRNRALVATLAAAVVTVAIVSTVAITRVIAARDRAEAAASVAEAERQRAQAEKTRADDRADGELLARARSVLESDPARSVAIVQQLPPTSARLDEALAVVRSARMFGGSVWGVRGSGEVPTHVELSPAGTHVLVLRRGGTVEIFPLDHPTAVKTFTIDLEERVDWLDDARLLVSGSAQVGVLDVATGARAVLPFARLADLDLTRDGRAVAFAEKQPVRVDITRQTVTPIAVPFAPRVLRISENGEFIVLCDDRQAAVIDSADRVLATVTFESKNQHVERGPGGRFVLSAGDKMWEIDAEAASPRFALLPPPTSVSGRGSEIAYPLYAGPTLYLRYWNGFAMISDGRAKMIAESKTIYGRPVAASHDQIAMLANDRELNLIDTGHLRRLRFPTAVIAPRLAGRRGVHYLVVAGRGQSLIYDLRAVAPRYLMKHRAMFAGFASNDTLIGGTDFGLDWIDIATGKTTAATLEGTVCCPELAPPMYTGEATVFAAGLRGMNAVYTFAAPYTDGKLYSGADLRVAHGAKFVMADGADLMTFEVGESPRRIATFKTGVLSLRAVERTFLLVTADELAIGDMITGAISERHPYKPTGPTVHVARWNDRILVADGATLTWLGERTPITTFDRNVVLLLDVEGGLLIGLEGDSGVHYVRLDREPVTVAPIGLALLGDARASALVGSGDGMSWVTFPSLVKAEIPIVSRWKHAISLSPDGRTMLEVIGQELWIWELPQLAGDTFAAARETTNLVELPTAVVWPWQVPDPAHSE